MSETRIKICGLTSETDARAAIDAGAHALGFNTWSGSKRFLDLAAAAPWLRELPPFVTRVALTVNAPLSEAERIASLPFIDALQLHGDENPAYVERLIAVGRPVIKALRAGVPADLNAVAEYPTPYFLLDAMVAGAYGGTGVTLDPALALEFQHRHPRLSLTLAGGLRPDNVAAAIHGARPYAVDVSSGVETAPGRKDYAQLRAFVAAVRSA